MFSVELKKSVLMNLGEADIKTLFLKYRALILWQAFFTIRFSLPVSAKVLACYPKIFEADTEKEGSLFIKALKKKYCRE